MGILAAGGSYKGKVRIDDWSWAEAETLPFQQMNFKFCPVAKGGQEKHILDRAKAGQTNLSTSLGKVGQTNLSTRLGKVGPTNFMYQTGQSPSTRQGKVGQTNFMYQTGQRVKPFSAGLPDWAK